MFKGKDSIKVIEVWDGIFLGYQVFKFLLIVSVFDFLNINAIKIRNSEIAIFYYWIFLHFHPIEFSFFNPTEFFGIFIPSIVKLSFFFSAEKAATLLSVATILTVARICHLDMLFLYKNL